MRALTAHRKAAAMPEPAVGAKVHQALDVHRHVAAEVALDHVVAVYRLADLQHLRIRELVHAAALGDVHLGDNLPSLGGADPVDILQRDDDALVRRNIDASDTSQVSSSSAAPNGSASCRCLPETQTSV